MTIPMVHNTWAHDWMEYFYEGELRVQSGRVEVPEDRYEWAQRLWMLGFTKTPEGADIESPLTYFEQVRDAKETDASEGANNRQDVAEQAAPIPARRVRKRKAARKTVSAKS